ncbi:MAG: hypothetical protein IPK39_17350 [Sulfuritalea sp.]|nr:hypothetical protein [Sulfuritalea sp.]
MGCGEVEALLSLLASTRHVAAFPHALSALLFLCGKLPGADLPWMKEIGLPRTKQSFIRDDF